MALRGKTTIKNMHSLKSKPNLCHSEGGAHRVKAQGLHEQEGLLYNLPPHPPNSLSPVNLNEILTVVVERVAFPNNTVL